MPFKSEEKKSLSIIASLYLIRMLGLFMVLPVLSLYGTELRGSTPFLIGLALGIYGLTQALLQIPFGWASDKVGRKKVLIVGFCLFVLGSLLCALADNICLLIIGRALQGAGAISAVLLALLADRVSEANRTVSMAIIGVSIGASFGLSVVAAPVIVGAFGGLSAIFNLSTLLGVLALLMVLLFVSSETPVASQDKPPVALRPLLTPNLIRMDFGIFALHFLQMCIWVAVPGILFEQLGVPIDRHWAIYLLTVTGGFIFMAPFMRLWDKRGQTKRAIMVAISCVLLSLMLMSQLAGYRFFVFGLFLFFWGFNLLEATLPSTATKLASAESRGTATGIYSTCQFMGVFLGGAAGGLVLSLYGSSAVFYLSTIIACVWLMLMVPMKNLDKPKGTSKADYCIW